MEHLLISFGLIVFLIILSAFFSASETGLTSVSRARIHRLSGEGNSKAGKVLNLLRDKDKMIGAILLGSNVVNITASSLTTQIFIGLYGNEGVIYATIIITILVVVFGEVMPKTYAFYNSEKVSLAVAPLITGISIILLPATNLVQRVVNFTFWLFRFKFNEENSAIETIKETIDLHHSEGEVVKHDKDMLQGILELTDSDVRSAMVHRKKIASININQKSENIIAEVLENIYTRIPVWNGTPDNIVGIIHSKSLLKEVSNCNGDLTKINWQLVLSEPWFIPETTKLKDQLLSFREKRNHIALVIDEYGALQGLITLEDILEEIVGHINDEYDKTLDEIVRQEDGSYVIEGATPIRDINRQLDWNLKSEGATTLAGMIIEKTMMIPDPGEEFEFHGIKFRVLKRHKNQLLYIGCREIKEEGEGEEK